MLFVLGAVGFTQGQLQEADRNAASKVVAVSNCPAVQTVDGTVSVNNLPAVQQVSGTVSVDSIPAALAEKRFQLTGHTAAAFDGAQGIFTYTTACQTELGPNSRMCPASEAMTTTDLPNLTGAATARPDH